jgi:hypothetical protein
MRSKALERGTLALVSLLPMTRKPSHRVHKPTYPIPAHRSQDWEGLAAMFRGMAEDPKMRANDLTRPLYLRAQADATAEAYLFAALMIDLTNCSNEREERPNVLSERFLRPL